MARKRQSVRLRRAGPFIGGVLSLAVALDIGRFAYTPLLPDIPRSLHWSVGFAGLVASANYAGYLVGALVAETLPGGAGVLFWATFHPLSAIGSSKRRTIG